VRWWRSGHVNDCGAAQLEQLRIFVDKMLKKPQANRFKGSCQSINAAAGRRNCRVRLLTKKIET
jgi:hypothetical protein